MDFSSKQLLNQLLGFPPAKRYWVACSGGADSHALLHAASAVAAQLPAGLAAVHVNHGIHADSGNWARHCEGVCKSLGVPFTLLRIDARPRPGMSPEAVARELRYEALRDCVASGEMLLTAHHLDDQAETLLLQLCRGAGPAGLSGMPPLRTFGRGWHARPLLPFGRAAIRAYAELHALKWIEDPSNADPRFDRNFLRNTILPRLAERRQGIAEVLARTAAIQAETAGLLEELAADDLTACGAEREGVLRLEPFATFSMARQSNLLRFWLKRLSLPLPSADILRRVHDEVITARPDATPCLAWPGAEIRRYRGWLFAGPPLAAHDCGQVVPWSLKQPLKLQDGVLTAETRDGDGIRQASCAAGGIEVRFRHGGEHLQPAGAAHTRELKLLFQERGIPPWLRDRVPLLYAGGRLAAVADLWVDAAFAAKPGEAAWRIHWAHSAAGMSRTVQPVS